jgi:hypothetical protein
VVILAVFLTNHKRKTNGSSHQVIAYAKKPVIPLIIVIIVSAM